MVPPMVPPMVPLMVLWQKSCADEWLEWLVKGNVKYSRYPVLTHGTHNRISGCHPVGTQYPYPVYGCHPVDIHTLTVSSVDNDMKTG
jgi:hypothetical protein